MASIAPEAMVNILPNEIDSILDEIEENENKIELKQDNNNDDNKVNWDEILDAIRRGNIGYIKNLIMSNEININSQNPLNGKTLLMYTVIVGNIELLKVICNFGAVVHIKDNDGDDALMYAIKYKRYKITELLYYQQLSGSLGNDLKNIATNIHHKNKEAEFIKNDDYDGSLTNEIVKYMTTAIEKQYEFGQDMLYYAWYFSGFKSRLWKQMMKTFEQILCDTSNKKSWQWLKTYFIPSLIWYCPHPENDKNDKNDNDDNDENNMERAL
eukprot:430503_1